MDDLWRAAWSERPRLLAIARRRSLNREDAEEVVGEAVLRCVACPGLDPARLPAMLTAVTLRLCVDRLRERVMAERHAHRLFQRDPDPHEQTLDRAEAVWLAAEVGRLTDSEKAALTARLLGLSITETAEALGITYRSAETALGRARRKLRSIWSATLGVLLPRRTRGLLLPALAAAVTAVAVCHCRSGEPPPVRRVRTVPERANGAEPVTLRAVRHAPAQRSIMEGSSTRYGSSRTPPPLATPDLRAGPVRLHPSTITLDPSDPVGRVKRCVQRGVTVTIDPASSVQVVCRD